MHSSQTPGAPDIADIKQQLRKLQELHDSGSMTTQAFDEARAPLERSILDWALRDTPTGAGGAESASPAEFPSPQRSRKVLAMSAVAAVVLVAAAYGWLTKSPLHKTDSGLAEIQNRIPMGAGGAGATAPPHATNSDQIGTMVDKLAARLKDNPADAAGWAMLARSYGVLARTDEAVSAYAQAEKLTKNDAGLLVDYADALAVKNNRVLAGEPMKLIERALKMDPRNVKGLAMAGTEAFERKEYAKAVKYWDNMSEIGGADNMFVKQIQPRLDEARQAAGMPAKAPAKSVAPASATAAPSNASVSGTVTLAASLAKSASPDDTVFIFARAAEGSRMPLAILRKQVKDLPVQFSLDDSTSMAGGPKLSQAGKIVVGARVSKSGQAMPEKGDLSGLSGPIAVGAKALKIEINEVIAK